jgi:transcription elongation factor Elf1
MKRDVELPSTALPPASIACFCGEKILVPMEALLQFKGGTCWNCGARLEVDAEVSAEAIGVLSRLNDRVQGVRRDAIS